MSGDNQNRRKNIYSLQLHDNKNELQWAKFLKRTKLIEHWFAIFFFSGKEIHEFCLSEKIAKIIFTWFVLEIFYLLSFFLVKTREEEIHKKQRWLLRR